MNFGFTDEQTLLRDQVRKFLDERCPSEVVREIMADEGYLPELWREMAQLGWLGLTIDPEHDGVGLGWVDMLVVLEEMGRSLYPSPFISTTLAASTLSELGSEAQQKQYLPLIASGRLIATLALLDNHDCPSIDNIQLTAKKENGAHLLTGNKPFVADAGAAQLFLTAFRCGQQLYLGLVDREQNGVSVTPSATMDLTKRTGSLVLVNVTVLPEQIIEVTAQALTRIFDKGATAVAAEIIGAAETVLTMTTGYAKDRVQFDQPIGKYQGVKHNLADMFVDIESIKSLTYYAAWTADESPEEFPKSASLAKAYASDAFAKIGIDGVQLHGAIGFTQEYDIQLYLKRSKWARPMFGDSDFHYERIASLNETSTAN
jgi:alkylation response protein AidB-like acyl-CoA dehydrogenase